MQTIKVSSDRDYDILIGVDWRAHLTAILAQHEKTLIIAPETLRGTLELDHANVFYTPEGEQQKEISIATQIWKILGDISLGRRDTIIGIGGGATTDLAGFVAATWLRGVEWHAIPTTMAAMVDAAIGGKTGINTSSGKNLVGAFYSPASVAIDLNFLDTLSDRDYSAGLAEVIKTGLIADPKIIEVLQCCENLKAVREHSSELIERSVRVKASVVSEDFKEGKLREILNFGHTYGHAVEKLSGYSLRHGEAVSIGLIYALYLSEKLASLDPDVTLKVSALLKKFSLPVLSEAYEWDTVLNLMLGDKKARSSSLRFIGIDKMAHPVWLESVPVDVAYEVYERITQ